MSLQECKRKHTAMEFLLWRLFLEEERQNRTKEEYYLAQIAAYLHNIMEIFRKNPKPVKKIESMLLDFKTSREVEDKPKRVSRKEAQKKLDQSKSFWFALVGLDKEGKKFDGRRRTPPGTGNAGRQTDGGRQRTGKGSERVRKKSSRDGGKDRPLGK